jgi:hypothetical protein
MQRQIIQSDFSGGEISSRMAMRADLEQYHRSLLDMTNFMPTLQGSAERTPGSRFVLDLGQSDENLRIIPYLTPSNERALITITDSEVKLYPNISDLIAVNTQGGGAQKANTQIIQRRQIVPNFTFFRNAEPWSHEPNWGPRGSEDLMGTKWINGGITGICRLWKYPGIDNLSCKMSVKATVSQPTNTATMIYTIKYVGNSAAGNGVDVSIKLGTTEGGNDLYQERFDETTLDIGQTREPTITVDMPTPGWTGDIYIEVEWTATETEGDGNQHSAPHLKLDRFGLWTDHVITIVDETVTGTPPWSADQLKDIHYIQSPYNRELDGAPSKELVLCHPQHQPQRLYLTGGGYVIEPIVFTNQPPGWSEGNYPSSCSSCLGRLVMAGGNLGPVAGSPVTSNTETVWATKVGKWNQFSQEDEVDPDDSLEFTTIYRSPIQWVFGQKELMVGAQEMEYIAMADGIFAPNDLGVAMHSNHGSSNIQPVGLGQEVLFAADGGTKVRAMSASNENVGFIAPDMTLWHPELCKTGIQRMVRLRNPHQMVACLLKSGEIALLHQDPYAGISGWSKMDFGANIYDIAVNTNEEGIDTLYMTVMRDLDGVKKLYLEAVANWTEDNEWDYMNSTYVYSASEKFNVIPNLEHLEGRRVQVVGEQGYLGAFNVVNGEVTLEDDRDDPQPIMTAYASVGLTMDATLRTLPVDGRSYRSTGVGALSRFSDISLRVRGSTRPRFGVISFNEDIGESIRRPESRSPRNPMEKQEPRELVADFKLSNLGTDIYQTIVVKESVPLRVEVLGIYGKLASESL